MLQKHFFWLIFLILQNIQNWLAMANVVTFFNITHFSLMFLIFTLCNNQHIDIQCKYTSEWFGFYIIVRATGHDFAQTTSLPVIFFLGGGGGGREVTLLLYAVSNNHFLWAYKLELYWPRIWSLLTFNFCFACHSLADNSSMEVSIVTSPKDIIVFPLKEELYSFGLTNVDILELDRCIYCCHFKLMMCGNPGN